MSTNGRLVALVWRTSATLSTGRCTHFHVTFWLPGWLTSLRMAAVNLVVIVESLRDIITHKGDDVKEFFLPSVIAVAVALGRCFRPLPAI
jgi:hypothetical protein